MVVRIWRDSSCAARLIQGKSLSCPSACLSSSPLNIIFLPGHLAARRSRTFHLSSHRPARTNPRSQPRATPAAAQQYQTPRSANRYVPVVEKAATGRRAPWPFIWSLVAVAFAASIGYSWTRLKIEDEGRGIAAATVPQDPSERYHDTAATFDDDVYWVEKISGMNRIRKRLVRKASGHVLEVSAGTGRNSDYYNLRECKSITFLDQAAEMTAICREKFDKSAKSRGKFFRNTRFVTQSALDNIEAPADGFDTVVQTFGLCSTGDPVELLRRLGKAVNQETGRILLLEHGRGIFGWLNQRLDESAAAHAHRHGCWWNRDIREIVEASGLEIVKEKRYLLHAGTTYWYELKPAKQQ